MKVALAQTEVIPGRPFQNIQTMKRDIASASQQGADVILFPEMSIGGYILSDLYTNDEYCLELMQWNEEIRKASKTFKITVWFGNVYLDPDINKRGKDGRRRRYNAAYGYTCGEPATRNREIPFLPDGIQFKSNLPTYRFFDEARYFFSMVDLANELGHRTLDGFYHPFKLPFGELLGIELCEDMWCADYVFNGHTINPAKYAVCNGADAIANLSASPWTFGKNTARDRRVKEGNEPEVMISGKRSGLPAIDRPLFYVNCVGVQNNGKNVITFDGGSTVYNSNAKPVILAESAYQEELIVVDTEDLKKKKIQRRRKKEKMQEKYEAIVEGLKAFPSPMIIGLSGGIDSAVVANLAVAAKGPQEVIGINMPSQYNKGSTKKNAEHVAHTLGIRYHIIPINRIVDAVRDTLVVYNGHILDSRVEENIQAKVRGTDLLSNIAQMESGIFLNCGNKVEMALGYATLYGDWGGAVSAIGDLTKAEVYEMARYINRICGRVMIPRRLLPDKLFRFSQHKDQPSAELKDDQVDPIRILYHSQLLEQILDYKKRSINQIASWWLEGRLHIEFGMSYDILVQEGLNKANIFLNDLEWFVTQMQNSIFKRIQSPPIIVVSKTCFGFDLRESMLPILVSIDDDIKKKIQAQETYKCC